MSTVSNKFTDGLQFFPVLESMRPVVQQLAVGTNDYMASQLIKKSKQQHVVKFTPNDSAKRFKDLNLYHKWQEDGHIVHWLLGKDYDLAGVIWYREKTFPRPDKRSGLEPSETFAIRLYEGYVGHHLSLPFMKLSLRTYTELKISNHQGVTDMWLSTTPENAAAIHTYLKLGYKEVYRDETIVLMTISAEDILQLIKIID